MILLLSFFSGLFITTISALIGYFVEHYRKTKSPISLSKSTMIGLIFLVVFFSLFKTSFQSINLICVPLVIFYMLFKKQNKGATLKINLLLAIKKNLLYITIIHFLSFLYFSFLYYDFDIFQTKYIWNDTVYYSNLSRGINNSGIENSASGLYQFNNLKHLNLYHYFDMWLNIIVTKISGLSHYNALTLVTYPVLLSTFYFTVIDIFIKNKALIIIVAALLPFVVNIPFFPSDGFFRIHGLDLNVLAIKNSKILINYILILAGSFALLEKNIREFLIYSLLLVIFYSTTIISIIPTIGTMLLIMTIKRKKFKMHQRELIKYFSMYLIILFALALFVFLNKDRQTETVTDSFQFATVSFKTTFIVFIEYYVKYFLSYSLALLFCCYTLYVIYRKKLLKENTGYIFVIIFVLLASFNAILFSSVFHGVNMNYPQSISNILVCCFTTLLIISYYTLHTKLNFKLNWFFYVFVFGIATCNIYKRITHNVSYPHKYSEEFKNIVLESFKNVKKPKYISISKGDNEYKVCGTTPIQQGLDFANSCYVYNRTNAFLAQVDNISVGIDFTYDLNFINRIDDFKERIKAEKITHIFTSKDILLNIPHKKLIVDSITKQRVYIL